MKNLKEIAKVLLAVAEIVVIVIIDKKKKEK